MVVIFIIAFFFLGSINFMSFLLRFLRAWVAELVDAVDLKSIAHWACGFNPRSRYHFKRKSLRSNSGAFFTYGFAGLNVERVLLQ